MKLKYAGIGSRETPQHVLEQMYLIAEQLAPKWLLRSGHALGADSAFEGGCTSVKGQMEIFVPWFGYNNAPQSAPFIRPRATTDLAVFSASFHPAWDKCTDPTKLLHMRNACIILGEYGDDKVDMVICWTKSGLGGGGTGQGIRIAQHFGIPVFDLAVKGIPEKLCLFVEEKLNAIKVA